jgi:predicted DNA-binding helix-hairpin-helix protein
MDGMQKLLGLSGFMNLEDTDEARPESPPECYTPADAVKPDARQGHKKDLPISKVSMGGRKVPIVKTVLTSACERNCYYCAFRSGRDFRRQTFKPEELSSLYTSIYNSGAVQGLFLSSGVAGGGVRTQDQLLATAEVLRKKQEYKGYLHLKLMPGAEYAQVERAMQLADRVSVNLEAPTTARLERLAPQKTFLDELLQPLRWVEEIRRSQPQHKGWNGRWPSSSTQFVVGAVGDTDLELLQVTDYLTNRLRLRRAYFSGFRPIEGTPLDHLTAENPWRTYRLYQASFLIRDYGFRFEDMPFAENGYLPLDTDPKLAWARFNLAGAPVELNRADLQELLRVPGIGPKGAQAILSARRRQRLHNLDDLKALGISVGRLAPYVLLAGRRPVFQPALF